jgi:hypothetical protein
MVVAGVYFFARMRKIDLWAFFLGRKFERGGRRGWYGWRKQDDYTSDPPPVYSDKYPPDEKNIPVQQQIDAFYSPPVAPPMATPANAAVLQRADSQRHEMGQETQLNNTTPFGSSSTPQPAALTATQNFYNLGPQPTSLSRQPGSQNTQVSQVSSLSNYNNTGTQNTFLTRNTSDAYDPNQREVNHLSYLSSLSSGFGDGLIMPDPTVSGANGRQSYRQSRNPGAARFSWMTNSQNPGARDRDTVYTTASIETAPRFRTVNSWVAQQAGRVERQAQSNNEVPSMPPLPMPLQVGVGVDHQRKPSEDPAFRHHPGEEVAIARGSRVASSILDTKIGGN